MSSPQNIRGCPPACVSAEHCAHDSATDGTLLDHRHQAQSLPRSGRSLSTTQGSVAPARSSINLSVAHAAVAGNITTSGRELLNSIQTFDDHEFAIDDEGQLGFTGTLDDPSHRDTVRPRRSSHLDTMLSAPLRPSPRIMHDSVNQLPALDLDRATAEAVIRNPIVPPRMRRASGNTRAEEERTSIDAPSHPDSQDGEDEEAEQDVCFPMSEEVRSAEGIDFDELEAFVAEESTSLPVKASRGNHRSAVSPKLVHITIGEKTGYSSGSETEVKQSSWNDESSATTVHRDYTSQFVSPEISALPSNHVVVPSLKHENLVTGRLTKTVSIGRPLTANHLRQMERGSNAPDRFSFFTSERDDTVHAAHLGGLLEGSAMTFKQLFRQDRGCWWLDVMCPTDSEMKMLAKAFGIHPLTAEDIRVQEAREKVELFKSYYFVCFKSFDHDKDSEDFLEPVNIYVVVFKHGLLSFHFAPTSHPANVRRRIRQLRDYVSVSADWISYAIIDDVTDVFMPLIHEIELETDAIEDAVMITRESDTGDMLRRIGECRKKVMALFRLLHGKADVIKMFAKRCNEQWDVAPKGEIGLYLGDIQDHLITMTSSLTQFEKILSRSHSNYLAQLSIHSMESNNRLNAVLGKITFIATMLVPMNLLTGLFGMNVKVPFGQPGPTLYPFFTIVGFIVVTMICAGIFAKRSRWL